MYTQIPRQIFINIFARGVISMGNLVSATATSQGVSATEQT